MDFVTVIVEHTREGIKIRPDFQNQKSNDIHKVMQMKML